MAEVIQQFDDGSIRRIAAAVRRLEAQYVNLRRQLGSDRIGATAHAIRTGVTTVNAAHPVYPSTGNQFVVQFEDLAFTELPCASTLEIAVWPSKFVVARTIDGQYVAQGTQVTILRIPGKRGRRWWIISTADAGMRWARSQENWRKNGGDNRIWCKLVSGTPGRTSATVSGSGFWIYLPRIVAGMDPNVISGTNIPYMLDGDGNATTIGSGHLDDKIGTVKMWAKTSAAIPAGWALMNGVLNAIILGGTGFNFIVNGQAAFPRYTSIDPGGGAGACGTSGGSLTDTIAAHSAADVAGCLNDHAGGTTGDGVWTVDPTINSATGTHGHAVSWVASPGDGAHTHNVAGDTGSGTSHAHTATIDPDDGAHDHGNTSESSGNTAYALTGITVETGYADCREEYGTHAHDYEGSITYVAADAGGVGVAPWLDGHVEPSSLSIVDDGHTHPIREPPPTGPEEGHCHSIGDHVHTVPAATGEHNHDIGVSSESAHTHSVDITPQNGGHHVHVVTISGDGAHGHSFTAMGSHSHSSSGHTHSGNQSSLTHETIDVVPLHLNLMCIERLDNSAGE